MQIITLQATVSWQDCAKYFNAVDHDNHDGSEYLITITTTCWYHLIFLWVLDCMIHMLHVVVFVCATNLGCLNGKNYH